MKKASWLKHEHVSKNINVLMCVSSQENIKLF